MATSAEDDWERAGFVIRWNSHTRFLMEAVSKLLWSGQFADVKLMCEGHTIQCHRFILQAFSPLFAQMIEEMDVHGGVIYLGNGIKFKQLQTLLTFMYTGLAGIPPEDMSDFLKLAENMKIRGLCIPDTTTNNVNGNVSDSTAACGSGQLDSEDDDEEGTTTAMVRSAAEVESVVATTSAGGGVHGQIPTLVEMKSEQSVNAPQVGMTGSKNASVGVDNGSGPEVPVSNEKEAEGSNTSETVVVAWNGLPPPPKKVEMQSTTKESILIVKKSARKRKSKVKVNKAVVKKMTMPSSTALEPTAPTVTVESVATVPVVAAAAGITKKKRKKVKSRRIPLTVSPYGENMKKALEAVANGGRLSQSAVEFGIPVSTLSKYVKNPDKMKTSKMYYFV